MKEMGHALSAEGGVVLGDQNNSDSFFVSVERPIKADAGRVFRACTESEELSHWFSLDVFADFSLELAAVEEKPEIKSSRLLMFASATREYADKSYVRLELKPGEDGTLVNLQHLGLMSFDEVCDLNMAWNWAMDSLKHYVEEGSGIKYETWFARREASVAIS